MKTSGVGDSIKNPTNRPTREEAMDKEMSQKTLEAVVNAVCFLLENMESDDFVTREMRNNHLIDIVKAFHGSDDAA